jgi:predicted MFS family arabinose efflux permease
VLTFYLQNGLGFSPLASGLMFLPMGIGVLISSLLTTKILPKLEARILNIGACIEIMGFMLLIITAQQKSNTGLQWSQILLYNFVIGIGFGLVVVPLINIILSRVRDQQHSGAASGVLSTMMQIGYSMGVAFIGSIFFDLVGNAHKIAMNNITSHSNQSTIHIIIHHYTDALVSSVLFSIGLVVTTFFLIFFLPSIDSKGYQEEKGADTNRC